MQNFKKTGHAIFVLFCTHNEYILQSLREVSFRCDHHGNFFRKRIFGNFHQANYHIIYDLFHHFRRIYELKIKFIFLDL